MSRQVLMKPTKADAKTFHCEFKSVDSNSRRIKGFANTKYKDRANDVVEPKAFDGAMGMYMENPILLYQHDMSKPIGKVFDFQVTGDGLFVHAEIAQGTKDSDEAWALISQGILKAFSIGFYPKDWTYDKPSDSTIINAIELIEISVVSIPANRESLFSVAKAFRDGTDIIDSNKPHAAELAVLEIKKQLTYLANVYAVLKTETKLEIDGLKVHLDTITSLDEKEALVKEAEALTRSHLIEASLRDSPRDSE